jgi:hypothetical protein
MIARYSLRSCDVRSEEINRGTRSVQRIVAAAWVLRGSTIGWRRVPFPAVS